MNCGRWEQCGTCVFSQIEGVEEEENFFCTEGENCNTDIECEKYIEND